MRCEGSGFSAAHGVWSRLCYCWSLVTTRFPPCSGMYLLWRRLFPGRNSIPVCQEQGKSLCSSFLQHQDSKEQWVKCFPALLSSRALWENIPQRWNRDGRDPVEQRTYLSLIPSSQSPPGLQISPARGSYFQTFMQKAEVMGNHAEIPFFWGNSFNTFSTIPNLRTRVRTSCSHSEAPRPVPAGSSQSQGDEEEAETHPLTGISVTWKIKLAFFGCVFVLWKSGGESSGQ